MMTLLMTPLTLSDINKGHYLFASAAPYSKKKLVNKRRAAGCVAEASSPNLAFIGGSFYYPRAPLPSTISSSPISKGQASAGPVGDIAKLRMSSSNSPSSSSSRKSYDYTATKSGSKRTTQQQEQTTTTSNSRNRGANGADHNRRGHTFRLINKEATLAGADGGAGAGIRKRPINTKRPPRWEREGDKLYAEVTKELDALYDNGVADDDGDADSGETNNSSSIRVLLSLLANKKEIASAQDVCRLLGPWTTDSAPETDDDRKTEATTTATTAADNDCKFSPPNVMWGSLPVGPVLVSRLYATGRMSPTSVQCAAFPILTAAVPSGSPSSINNGNSRSDRGRNASSKYYSTVPKMKTKTKTKRSNGIIASPTGTGKTLAYLLPLLCTSPGGQIGEGIGGILIVTPTIELACQIQREVDVLWPPLKKKKPEGFDGSGRQLSSLFVVGDVNGDDSGADVYDDADDLSDISLSEVGHETTNEDHDSYEVGISPGRMILRSIEQNAPTIIAGTPKMLRTLYREAGRIVESRGVKFDVGDDDPITDGERATSLALKNNLRAIVLDEADRLLRTEAVARETTERKNRKMEQRRAEAAAEEQLAADVASLDGVLRPLPVNKKKPRLVIARQTQTEFLLRDLPLQSLDDVQLICASATVGRTMRRQLMQILDKNSADAAATLVTGDDDPRVKSKNAETRKSVLLPEKLRHAYRVVELVDDGINSTEVENDEEYPSNEKEEELLDYGNIIMPSSPSATMAVRNEDIRVKNTIDALWNTMMMSETEAKPIIIFPGRMGVERVQQELMSRGANDVRTLRSLDGKRRASRSSTEDDDSPAAEERDNNINKWKKIPIYIIGERFARGLDLPDVEYVFMLSPPSSAAGYAHMAGRTGRSGRSGTAITLVRPRNNEVQRLAAIAEALGLKFTASLSGSVEGGKGQDSSGTFRVDGAHVDTDNDKL